MKIALLVLSGDSGRARENLLQRYPDATIEMVPRDELERLGPRGRLRAARSRRADIFAVATERLAWQRGQNAILLFGASAARRVILLDSYGDVREESRRTILSRLPFRTAGEMAASRLAVANSRLGQKNRRPEQHRLQQKMRWQQGVLPEIPCFSLREQVSCLC